MKTKLYNYPMLPTQKLWHLCFFFFLASIINAQEIDDPKYPFHPDIIVEFTSSNLPIVIIELEEPMADKEDDERVPASMKIVWNQEGERNQITDEPSFEGPIGIKYRGNSTYSMSEKKPFAIRALNEEGKKNQVPILDMPAHDDWALLAPFNDRSMMRDVLMFDLMRGAFDYTPTGRYCEVVLNGIYQGVYIMAARVRQGENRINIEAPTDDEGMGLTGGYHLELDRMDEPGFSGQYRCKYLNETNTIPRSYYQYKFPDEEDLSEAQIEYIQNRVFDMERAACEDYFQDPDIGFRSFMDTVSLAAMYIAQEFSKNVDAYRFSTPFYKYPDSIDHRFKFTIWDFNGSLGISNYCGGWCHEGWMHNMNQYSIAALDGPMPWMFKHILKDGNYTGYLKSTWNNFRQERLSDKNITSKIDSLVNLLQESQERNFTAWNRFGVYVWPNYYVASSWEEEVSYLRAWIKKRAEWIDVQWNGEYSNLVANGNFEAVTTRGAIDDVWCSEWSYNANPTLTSNNQYEGKYALSISAKDTVYQIMTEVPLGFYKLKAWVKTQGDPDAYMYFKYQNIKTGLDEHQISITNSTNYSLLEISHIVVSNDFVEIGFAKQSNDESAILYIDSISFVKQDVPVSNEIIRDNEKHFRIGINRDLMELYITTDYRQEENVEIFDIRGNKIYSSKITSSQKRINNIFSRGQIYIVRIGNTGKKIFF